MTNRPRQWAAWIVIGAAVAGCSTLNTLANKSAFSDAETQCRANHAGCESRCHQQADRAACDVLVLERIEEDPEKHANDSYLAEANRICRDGIDRGCAAAKTLRPLVSKANKETARHGAAEREHIASNDAALQELLDRAGAVRSSANALIQSADALQARCRQAGAREEAGCRAPVKRYAEAALSSLADFERRIEPYRNNERARQHADFSRRILIDDLLKAEKTLAEAQAMAQERRETVGKAEEQQAERQQSAAQWKATSTACEQDPEPCRATCEQDAASDECQALAVLFKIGAAQVTKSGPNYKKANELATAGCERGNRYACRLVVAFAKAGEDCEDEESCKSLCEQQNGAACGQVGDFASARRNVALATRYYVKGCEYGHPGSCNASGTSHFDGLGVPKNRTTAHSYFKRSCDIYQSVIAASEERNLLVEQLSQTACGNFSGTTCLIRVQKPAARQPAYDQACRRQGVAPYAWSLPQGDDYDECLYSVRAHGCTDFTDIMCCPDM